MITLYSKQLQNACRGLGSGNKGRFLSLILISASPPELIISPQIPRGVFSLCNTLHKCKKAEGHPREL